MPRIIVKKVFQRRGRVFQPGMTLTVPDNAIEKLGDFIEVEELSEYEKQLQQSSSEWRQLCDSHERTLPDQYCKLKRDRPLDPFTGCVGWQMKTGKKVTLN